MNVSGYLGFSLSLLYLQDKRTSPRVKQTEIASSLSAPAETQISWPRPGPVHTASSLSTQFGHRKTSQAIWPRSYGSAHCPKSQLQGYPGLPWSPRNRCILRAAKASLWTQWTTCAPRCGQQRNGKAGRLSPQRVRAPGAHEPSQGLPLRAGSPSPFRSQAPPDLSVLQSREALEDTRRRHLLKRLHSFTSVLRQHLPGPRLGPECPPPGCGGSTLQPTSLLRRWAEPYSSLSNKRSFYPRLTCKQSNQ